MDGAVSPAGVALITDYCRFMWDGIYWTSQNMGSNDTSLNISQVPIDDYNDAILDFNGKTNFDNIIGSWLNIDGFSDFGIAKCYNYTFANGAKGRMWSMGEAHEFYENFDEMIRILTLCGLTSYNSSYFKANYWTTTLAANASNNPRYFWLCTSNTSYMIKPANYLYQVTPIADLNF